jgi:hypothetical protein
MFPTALVAFCKRFCALLVDTDDDCTNQIATAKDVLFDYNDVKAICIHLAQERLDVLTV